LGKDIGIGIRPLTGAGNPENFAINHENLSDFVAKFLSTY
jgi:hypothetical protein